MMGHSLGAAGAIEAVISLLALRDQILPPNINFRASRPGPRSGYRREHIQTRPNPHRPLELLRLRRNQRLHHPSIDRRMSLGIGGMGWVTPLGKWD